MPFRSSRPLLLLLLLATVALGCSRDERPLAARAQACQPLVRSEPAKMRSVVFVLTDTTRRDRIGVYGGPAQTPHFDRFARGGILFTAASTQAPWTKPAVATLFTGLPPSAHGVVSHPSLRSDPAHMESDVLGGAHDTLAESLAAAGYQTAAFVSNPWVQKGLGFDQGFEVWDESLAANATPGEVVTGAGLRWLHERQGDERPFFLYLHYMDAHEPYHRVSREVLEARRAAIEADERPVSAQARTAIAWLARDEEGRPLAAQGVSPNLALFETVYDLGVEHFDRTFGQLLEGLDSIPGAADAAVIVTSDHGEALFERGWRNHGYGLHENETGIPLAANLPGVRAAGRISCPVGLVDLRQTLCDYLGVPCQGEDQGISLLSPAFVDPERVVLTESVIGRPRNRAVRDLRHKLLYEPEGRGRRASPPRKGPYRLYDLAMDPAEEHNLLGADAEVVAETRAAFVRLREVAEASAAAPRAAAERIELTPETRRRLEALGYLDPEP